jgi:hypothetical protein
MLYDPIAFFFFHIDAKSLELLEELKNWLTNDQIVSKRCNHAIMPNSWNIIWGFININNRRRHNGICASRRILSIISLD